MGRRKTRTEPRACRLLDPDFRRCFPAYFGQCLLATVTIFVVLLVLDSVTQTVLVASLGASAFIAFTMPHIEASRPRYLLGGYAVGTLSGCVFAVFSGVVTTAVETTYGGSHPAVALGIAALATGTAIFLMVILDMEHPPAAALALGYTLNEWDAVTIVVVFTGILAISAIKEFGQAQMIDLL